MNTPSRPTAVLADDERLMREQFRARIEAAWPELEIVAEAKNGEEAVHAVAQHAPDFAFLDIRMPGMNGLEAAHAIAGKCHVVFITAYDEYAVQAFEQGAVDYVLKPAEPERLALTIARLKAKLAQPVPDVSALLAALTARFDASGEAPRRAYLQWIQASIGSEIRMIAVDEILYFTSDEKYTRVQTASQEALIRKPIKELVDELDPETFWQIHRATLVNARAIAGVTRDFRGRQLVLIKGRNDKLEVSRSYTHLFKQM